MKLNERNRQSNWKRKIPRLIALLLVLYAFADVTVLQEYCGNENVGIPSYAQQVRAERRRAESSNDAQTAFKTSDSSPQEQVPDIPNSEEDCFCCCSHTLLGFSPLKSYEAILVVRQSDSNFSHKYRYSSSHLRLVYQPPKLA